MKYNVYLHLHMFYPVVLMIIKIRVFSSKADFAV